MHEFGPAFMVGVFVGLLVAALAVTLACVSPDASVRLVAGGLLLVGFTGLVVLTIVIRYWM